MVGSAEEYGTVEPDRQPIRETEPLRPQSPYAVSKAAQEMLALQYASSHGLDVVLVRSFNHSGPGQSDRFVLPGFARQIATIERGEQEPLLRVGNLDVWRDFLDVLTSCGRMRCSPNTPNREPPTTSAAAGRRASAICWTD